MLQARCGMSNSTHKLQNHKTNFDVKNPIICVVCYSMHHCHLRERVMDSRMWIFLEVSIGWLPGTYIIWYQQKDCHSHVIHRRSLSGGRLDVQSLREDSFFPLTSANYGVQLFLMGHTRLTFPGDRYHDFWYRLSNPNTRTRSKCDPPLALYH